MCGIAGTVLADREVVDSDRELVSRMVERIKHRGPDNLGGHTIGGASFGHARLSILDLSADGNQPMVSDDGRIMLVCNGEIYNFRELRSDLEGRGAIFRSRSDSEVILHGYREWGVDVVKKLRGMFAFAIWDQDRQRLLIARDRFGIKPLYLRRIAGRITFASEIKALLCDPNLKRRVDMQALTEFLWFGNALCPRTFFSGIEELSPGHYLLWSPNSELVEAYWTPETLPVHEFSSADAVGRTWELVEKAVRSHLVSDVPVGLFLSGGMDSSAIAWCAGKYADSRISTYSVGFDFDNGVNELSKARRVAKHCGTEHHELVLEAHEIPDLIGDLLDCHDEPFADAANIPLYLLCRELKGGTKVVMQGDGGDEIFGGYRRHSILAEWPKWRLAAAIHKWAGFVLPKVGRWRGFRKYVEAVGEASPEMCMAMLLTVERLQEPPDRVFREAFRLEVSRQDAFSKYRLMADRFRGLDPLQKMLYTDSQIILSDDFLKKVDRATMAHGIEVRVPLLDCELSEFVMRMPSALKVRKGSTKWLLREGLRGKLPEDILNMPKAGFGVPYSHWLRTSLQSMMREILLASSSPLDGVLDRGFVSTLVEEHVAGVQDHGILLWKLMHLGLWLKRYSVSIV